MDTYAHKCLLHYACICAYIDAHAHRSQTKTHLETEVLKSVRDV